MNDSKHIKLGTDSKYYTKFLISVDEIVSIFNSLPNVFYRLDVIEKLTEIGHGRAKFKSSHIIYFLRSKKLIRIISLRPTKCMKLKEKISVDDIL